MSKEFIPTIADPPEARRQDSVASDIPYPLLYGFGFTPETMSRLSPLERTGRYLVAAFDLEDGFDRQEVLEELLGFGFLSDPSAINSKDINLVPMYECLPSNYKNDFVNYVVHTLETIKFASDLVDRGSDDCYTDYGSYFLCADTKIAGAMVKPAILEFFEAYIKNSTSSEELRPVIESLLRCNENSFVENILLSESIEEESRLKIAVSCMNVLGVIPVIDMISEKAKDNEHLTILYNTLQGREVGEVMSELAGIYEKIEYAEYALNTETLNEQEVHFLIDNLPKDWDTADINMLDLGAGTGGHAFKASELGVGKVVAFDCMPKHIERIKQISTEKNIGVTAVEGDWNELVATLTTHGIAPHTFESFGCFTHTIMHNRTPEALLHWFDQLTLATTDNAVGLISIADTRSGVYKARVEHLKDIYKSLGVDSTRILQIFDGPTEDLMFNRMAISDEQFKCYLDLFGYRIRNTRERVIDEDSEVYTKDYIIEKDPNFTGFNPTHARKMFEIIGLNVNFSNSDIVIKSWRGFSLGVVMWVGWWNEKGNPPAVS